MHRFRPPALQSISITSVAARPLRTVGFWTAVCLPFVHVPLLLSGIASAADAVAFAVLLAANLLALVLGHGHDPG